MERRSKDPEGVTSLKSGAQLIAEELVRAGVDTVFGIIGGPMVETIAELHNAGLRVISCRHEGTAGFMAAAWGYVNRKPGVLVVGSGPGMTNAVTPMYVANESGMPLVVLGGSARSSTRGFGGFQEIDQVAYAAPACKWTLQADSVRRIPEYMHLALGNAMAGRPGAVYLDFPGELITQQIPEERVRFRATTPALAPPQPDPAAVDVVAGMLAAAERPLILIGKGAAWADAGPQIQRLVDLGIPFVASPTGRGTIPDDHPLCVNAARTTALSQADVLLAMGARFNWIFQLGNPRKYAPGVRIVQVDVVPEEMYSGADIELGIVADCAATAASLADALTPRSLRAEQRQWTAVLQEACRKNEAAVAEPMDSDRVPINHHRLLRDLRDTIDRGASVAADGELTMAMARMLLPSYHPRRRLNAGPTGCVGTGVPYAIGAKLARPDEQAVAIVGDYAFGAGCNEIETAARVGANVVFVIANNAGVTGHAIQDRLLPPGAPPIAALIPAHYEQMAQMVGGYGERVTDPAEIVPAIRRALDSNAVAVVNVLTDPNESGRSSYL